MQGRICFLCRYAFFTRAVQPADLFELRVPLNIVVFKENLTVLDKET
jgi:hypothetical protein